MTERVVAWFSAGAASAVATKLTLAEYGPDRVEIAYTDPGSEHPDNVRFLDECEEWFDHTIIRLSNPKYADTWQVWEERRFLVGPTGALCTAELKKRVRFAFQYPDDVQVFGYTSEEKHRAVRFREQNPGVDLRTPLIDRGLTKNDCLAMLARAGIRLPAMYLLGYHNNNCIGCVKGGHSLLSDAGGPVWLDELNPGRGDYPTELSMECSLLCAIAEDDLDPARPS